MKIGSVNLTPPFALAPMAGMTDTAFRRLVKRRGGCGLVVTEMVSSEGLVRGIDRTLEYAEYTEEERPVSIQIFGGDPEKMAAAAQIVEGMGADIVDVNMGCPVPKIAKHNAGCSLMREPEHAQSVVAAMTKAVKIPVTVKMRAGWDATEINAPEMSKRMQDAGAAALAVNGRTAAYPACSSAAVRSATPGSSSRPRRSRAANGRVRSRWPNEDSSCSTTSTCCSTSVPERAKASATSRRPGPRPTALWPQGQKSRADTIGG